MTPIATDLLNTLLEHHQHVCRSHTFRPPIIDRCLITYGALSDRAGHPGLAAGTRGIGPYLAEVALWCHERQLPPINALVVNSDSRMPGDSYSLAEGCDLFEWPTQVESVICCEGYLKKV